MKKIAFNKRVLGLQLVVCGLIALSWMPARGEIRYGDVFKYKSANEALGEPKKGENRVVFIGNSITEIWFNTHPEFFKQHGYIGRGISGQVTCQFLVRFQEDVVKLHPRLVVINGGTNDIAQNLNEYREDLTYENIISMAEIAKANNIKVIITAVSPVGVYPWRGDRVKDVPQKIVSLNKRLKDYAVTHKIPYVDYYYSKLLAADGKSMDEKCSEDGVHPVLHGYNIMEDMIVPVINKALK
jgi:lysophospholipase L1-like esterase